MQDSYGKEYLFSLGQDFDRYIEILENAERAFRANSLKISLENFRKFSKLECKATFLPFAFTVKKEQMIGNSAEFSLGYIHIQALSSMVPALALNAKPHSKVLDVAASPGGKTTQIAENMNNSGVLIANDLKTQRLSALSSNVNRLGVLNCIITGYDGRSLPWKNHFDYVLVDAPCSALGSSSRSVQSSTHNRIRDLARIQRKMILSSFDSLKQNGSMVYSTCTVTKEENEEIIKFLLEERKNAGIESINLHYEIPHDTGLNEYGREFRKTWRIYPKHFNSEGFFIAKIRKT